MKLFEHKHFLESEIAYQKAKSFWENVIQEIKPCPLEYIDNIYSNGIPILDGNPLYTAYYPNKKAVRIIQNRISSQVPILACWIQKSLIKETEISELVIFLQPLEYIYGEVIELIRQQINGKLTNSYVENVNRHYQARWDQVRYRRIIKRLNGLDIFKENLKGEININEQRLKEFVTIVSIENSYINVSTKSLKSSVSIALKKVETRVLNLTNVVTLKGSFSMTRQPTIHSYTKKINKTFSSKSSFNRSLISKVRELKTELYDFKT